MVNPGGTGNPALVISAKPEPLPPSTSFILPSPWASACRFQSRTGSLEIPRVAPCHSCSVKQSTGGLIGDFLGFVDRWPHTGAGNVVVAIAAVSNAQHKSARNEALYSELKKLAT